MLSRAKISETRGEVEMKQYSTSPRNFSISYTGNNSDFNVNTIDSTWQDQVHV